MPAAERPDADYPLVLITGRQLEHWHTGSMTRRSAVLDALEPDPVALIHPLELERLGPIIEHDPIFPERVNVNVASVAGPDHLKLRVWERGAGLTRACGTGACATAVAAIRRGLVQSPVRVTLPGGDLTIAWEPSGTMLMSGPATTSFRGTFDWDDYAAGAAG